MYRVVFFIQGHERGDDSSGSDRQYSSNHSGDILLSAAVQDANRQEIPDR